jgi:sterol desaturase/sphingolipid hydroxylase (fatty acid hydroxylase superfamily)
MKNLPVQYCLTRACSGWPQHSGNDSKILATADAQAVRQHILTTAMEIITPEENPDRHVGRKRTAEKQLLIISINFLAFFGFAIIAYGLAAQIYQETWGVLERIANFVSTTSTLLGALLTFLSVYLKPNARLRPSPKNTLLRSASLLW